MDRRRLIANVLSFASLALTGVQHMDIAEAAPRDDRGDANINQYERLEIA